MHRSMKRTVILLAVAGVTLAATLSCQPCGDKASLDVQTIVPEAQPADNLELRGDRNTLINAIRVERGGTAEFRVTNGTAYVLIPDAHLAVVDENMEVRAVGSFLAFIVDGDGATVKIPADYPKSDHDTVIRYSVLCFDEKGKTYYAEDESPPRIIIPKYP